MKGLSSTPLASGHGLYQSLWSIYPLCERRTVHVFQTDADTTEAPAAKRPPDPLLPSGAKARGGLSIPSSASRAAVSSKLLRSPTRLVAKSQRPLSLYRTHQNACK